MCDIVIACARPLAWFRGRTAVRIALATSSYAPYVGGVEEHVRNVARELSARGHDVVVWTVARDGRAASREYEDIDVRDLPTPLPARNARSLLHFALRAPAAWLRWRRAWRSFHPDIIHVHCFGPNGTYARILARRTGTPLIVTSHGETLADDNGLFHDSRLARESLTAALREAVAVTGCSQVVLDDLNDRFALPPGQGVIVPNGIDLDEPIGAAPTTGRYIAAVGRLQKMKGFDLLIQGFAEAACAPDVHLVIGGDGPEREALLAIAYEAGVADRVHLPGQLDRPQVAGLLSNALAVVVPSRFEAFGIAALEAWRAGAALIATTRGGPPEFVRDGRDGLLVDPADTSSLAAAIRSLVTDVATRSSLAGAGAERVRQFTWSNATDAYDALYQRVTVDAPGR